MNHDLSLKNNATRSRAPIALHSCLDKSIQTRKISRQKCTEVCLASSVYYFIQETRNGLREFKYFDSSTWCLAVPSNSFKNSLVFPPFHCVEVASLC